ncbi:hypothetical protein EUX98_g1022 [Antrodiella citrinella]|uniref:25S rRNA (uridine-N(3))-methyltransferase BMT5-like domain-containing protein n=1 Tax=Antrodiella citrinella TaxID=2447956 RepID=A0A4S4N2J4_9APHY|nr:hypothetical protein EUX98_g1022 [Antrodiella citrinella]
MAKGKKSSLKAALSSQQSRLKKKEEAKHAARIVEQKGQKKPQAKEIAPRTPTIPFVSSDRILLVGEGNFSYTRALAINPPESLQYLPAENITATAYDDEKECYAKYPEAEGIVAALREKGVQVLFQVDATKLDKCHALKGRRFDKIVWNFPHAGKGITDQDRNILSNQIMLLGFLRSASEYLTHGPLPQSAQLKPNKGKGKQEASDDEDEDEAGRNTTGDGAPSRGKLLITLRNVPPYTLWWRVRAKTSQEGEIERIVSDHNGFGSISRRTFAKPIIAAVNGSAYGGGTEMVMNCDIVVASEEATFQLPEVKRGVVAVQGGMPRLGRIAGHQLASEMLLTGRPVPAQEAYLRFGFVNKVVPKSQVLAAALDFALQICQNSPDAVQSTKRALVLTKQIADVEDVVAAHIRSPEGRRAYMSENIQEGLNAFGEVSQIDC